MSLNKLTLLASAIAFGTLSHGALAQTPSPDAASAAPSTGSTTAPDVAAAPTAPAPVPAATTAKVDAGDVVKDSTGAVVGKIEAVEGNEAVLATANSKVRVPVTSFAPKGEELVFGMTAAQVDAAAKAAAPAPAPSL